MATDSGFIPGSSKFAGEDAWVEPAWHLSLDGCWEDDGSVEEPGGYECWSQVTPELIHEIYDLHKPAMAA